jgi:hypothetical protein
MLAGDLFDSPRVLWRLRIFKVLYAIRSLLRWRHAWAARSYRMLQARSDFTGGTTPLDKA